MSSSNRLENLRGVIGAGLQHTNTLIDDMDWLDTSSEGIGLINVNRILEDVQAFDLKKLFIKDYQESIELKHLIDKVKNHNQSSSNINNANNYNNNKYQSGDKQTKRRRDYQEDLPDPKKKAITAESSTHSSSSSSSSSDTCRRVLPFVNKANGNLDLPRKRSSNDKKENFENSNKGQNGHANSTDHFVNKNNNANGLSENGLHSTDHSSVTSPSSSIPSSSSSSSSRSQVNTTPGNKKRPTPDNPSDHHHRSSYDRKESKNNYIGNGNGNGHSNGNGNGDSGDHSSIKKEVTPASNKDSREGRDPILKDDKGRRDWPTGRSTNSNNDNNNNNNNNNNHDDKISKSTSFNQPTNKISTLAMQLDAEGRDLKHIADCKQGVKLDKTVRATKYIEAGLKFVQSLECREDDPVERMSNIIVAYNRMAQYFKESAHMFVDWQKDKDCPPLSLFVTLCYVCESVLLYKRHCKALLSLKKRKDEKAKEIKILTTKYTDAPHEQSNVDGVTKLLQESARFMEELTEVLSYTDPWDKALSSSKNLSHFNLPPAHITLKELVIFVKRELGVS